MWFPLHWTTLMTTYVAFLRGINVGAHNRMTMDALRDVCESLGVEHVRTHIQSGNVVFETKESDANALGNQLVDAIEDAFGYEISVMVRTREELGEIIDRCPFADPADDATKLYVTFLSDRPDDERVRALPDAGTDAEEFELADREVYSRIRTDEGKRGQFTDVGTVLGVPATRRAWNVVTKVYELAR